MSFFISKVMVTSLLFKVTYFGQSESHPDWSHLKFPVTQAPTPVIWEFPLGCICKLNTSLYVCLLYIDFPSFLSDWSHKKFLLFIELFICYVRSFTDLSPYMYVLHMVHVCEGCDCGSWLSMSFLMWKFYSSSLSIAVLLSVILIDVSEISPIDPQGKMQLTLMVYSIEEKCCLQEVWWYNC